MPFESATVTSKPPTATNNYFSYIYIYIHTHYICILRPVYPKRWLYTGPKILLNVVWNVLNFKLPRYTHTYGCFLKLSPKHPKMISLVEKHPWLWLLGTTFLGNPHIHVLDIDPKGVDSLRKFCRQTRSFWRLESNTTFVWKRCPTHVGILVIPINFGE